MNEPVKQIKKGGPQSEAARNQFQGQGVDAPGNSGQSAARLSKPVTKKQQVDQRNIGGITRGDFTPQTDQPFTPDRKEKFPRTAADGDGKVDAVGNSGD